MGICIQPLFKPRAARLKKNRDLALRVKNRANSTLEVKIMYLSTCTGGSFTHQAQRKKSLPTQPFSLKKTAHTLNTSKFLCRNFPPTKKDYSEVPPNNILYYFTRKHLADLVSSSFGTIQTKRNPLLALGDSIAARSIQGKNCLPDLAHMLTHIKRTTFKTKSPDHYSLHAWQNNSYPAQQALFFHNSNRSTACHNMALNTLFIRH